MADKKKGKLKKKEKKNNSTHVEISSSSIQTSDEIENTIEIGKVVGFEMNGYESEIRNIVKGAGLKTVCQ